MHGIANGPVRWAPGKVFLIQDHDATLVRRQLEHAITSMCFLGPPFPASPRRSPIRTHLPGRPISPPHPRGQCITCKGHTYCMLTVLHDHPPGATIQRVRKVAPPSGVVEQSFPYPHDVLTMLGAVKHDPWGPPHPGCVMEFHKLLPCLTGEAEDI